MNFSRVQRPLPERKSSLSMLIGLKLMDLVIWVSYHPRNEMRIHHRKCFLNLLVNAIILNLLRFELKRVLGVTGETTDTWWIHQKFFIIFNLSCYVLQILVDALIICFSTPDRQRTESITKRILVYKTIE